MTSDPSIDGVLVQWGERLFYPGNRIVANPPAYFHGTPAQRKANFIRRRIEATVRRAPQVMVKVTGGGRGMAAIAAHFRYITKNGRLDFEDERGITQNGKDELHDLEHQWRFGGAYIGEDGHRREAFNIMLSMPRGTDPLNVRHAAREFAKAEFADHCYVMVLHDHQANPHVHLSVKAVSKHGQRLNPRKADLQRWRETFAQKLGDRGIDAEATRQATRGQHRNYEPLWRLQARQEGRLRLPRTETKVSRASHQSRTVALKAWKQIAIELANSTRLEDKQLARQIVEFVWEMPSVKRLAPELVRERQRERVRGRPVLERERSTTQVRQVPDRTRDGPEMER